MPSVVAETVMLPGGLLRPDGSAVVSAEVRELCGADEQWLLDCPTERSVAVVTSELLSRTMRCIGSSAPDDARALLVADRDYALLQLRRVTFGDAFVAVVRCPECRSLMDVTFDAEDIPVESRPQRQRLWQREVTDAHGVTRSVTFRLPTGADQEAVASVQATDRGSALLARCVESVDGHPAESVDLGVLGDDARAEIANQMEVVAPVVELAMDLTCPECSRGFGVDVDLAHLLLQEMRASVARLAEEVHALAFYYRWSQQEILSLSRDRRREYFGLISGELRRTGE